MGLEDYKALIANSASICTMGHMLSGTLVCRDIYKKGTSDGFDIKPFVGGLGMGMIMLQYAFIVNDSTMIDVNLFGLLTSVAYIALFYIYAPNNYKNVITKMIGKTIAIVTIILVYAIFEHRDKIDFRFGILTTILQLLLFASPLMNLGEVLKTKSTKVLPFPWIVMGVLVSSQWFLYGLIVKNSFIIFQNIAAFMLYLVQLSLFLIFPSKSVIFTKVD